MRNPGNIANLMQGKRPKPPVPLTSGKPMTRMKANPALGKALAPAKSVTGNPGTAAASKVRLSNIEAATRRGGFPVARPPMERRTRIIGRGKGR